MKQLQDMIELSTSYDLLKADFQSRANHLSFDEQARLSVPQSLFGTLPPLKLTDWAFKQLCSKLGPTVYGKGSNRTLPVEYLQAIRPDLRATILNRHLRDTNNKQWLVRTYDGAGRAILAGDYPTVSNTEITQVLNDVVRHEEDKFPGFHLVRPSVSPDDLNIKAIWKDVAGGTYGIGVYLGNGEIGDRKLRLFPAIKRNACDNSIILDHENGLELIHRGSLRAIMVQLKAAIGRVFHLGADLVDAMIEAEAQHIPDFSDVLNGLAIKHGWDKDTTQAVFFGAEGQQTRAGLVNGISWAAYHAFDDANTQVDFETLAGRILVAPDSIFGRAARLYQEVERV